VAGLFSNRQLVMLVDVSRILGGPTRSLCIVSVDRSDRWATRTGRGDNGGKTNREEENLVDIEHRRDDEGQPISEEGAKHRSDTVGTIPQGDADGLLVPSVPCHCNDGC
jgi:hypothetical protein